MHRMNAFRAFAPVGAILLGLAVLVTGIAWAGDDAPATKPAAEAKTAPATEAAPATATPSPIHSILKWVGSHVMDGDCACPSTEQGAAAWQAWFSAGADAPLASLRDALVKDGWNGERTIGFFKQMASSKSCGDCKDCPEGSKSGSCCDKSAKGSCCDKSKAGKADSAAPTDDATGAADASESEGKCPCTNKAKGECSGCDKAGCACTKKAKTDKPVDAKPQG